LTGLETVFFPLAKNLAYGHMMGGESFRHLRICANIPKKKSFGMSFKKPGELFP